MNLTDRWIMFEGVDTQFRVLIKWINKWGKKPDQQTHLCGLTHFCCPKYQMMAGPGCWPRDWWIHGFKKWGTCLSLYFHGEDYENKQYAGSTSQDGRGPWFLSARLALEGTQVPPMKLIWVISWCFFHTGVSINGGSPIKMDGLQLQWKIPFKLMIQG